MMDSAPTFATLRTWGGRTTFSYRHSGSLSLEYGSGRRCRVSAAHLVQLCAAHRGQLVAVFGEESSLDAWTEKHITRMRIASYLAPALVELGLAERSGEKIKFF